MLTCEGGTLEVPQPLGGVTAPVGQEVWPVAGVEVGVIGQAQHHRHVGVLRLTRHLGGVTVTITGQGDVCDLPQSESRDHT